MRKWDVVLSKSYAYYIHILHNTMDKKEMVWFIFHVVRSK